jgi:hypothetical protein
MDEPLLAREGKGRFGSINNVRLKSAQIKVHLTDVQSMKNRTEIKTCGGPTSTEPKEEVR